MKEKDPWVIACCGFCGQPAEWRQLDRISWSWQCPNSEHGYKYLSEKTGTVKWVKVQPCIG